MATTTPPPLVLVPTLFEARALLAQAGLGLRGPCQVEVDGRPCTLALTGVGPVAAAAMAYHWLRELTPPRVLLVGLAGTLDSTRAAVGQLLLAESLRLHGVGAGEGPQHEPLPFDQIPAGVVEEDGVGSHLSLNAPASLAGEAATAAEILTVTTAAADEAEAQERRRRYPDAVAEEMEGFGVALAARLAGVPLVMLRGVSNVAGQRRIQDWNVDEVLGHARDWIGAWLAEVRA